jgi:hypothetical protein
VDSHFRKKRISKHEKKFENGEDLFSGMAAPPFLAGSHRAGAMKLRRSIFIFFSKLLKRERV